MNEIEKSNSDFENGKRVRHKTLLKIIFNPILRLFGLKIVSCFDENDKFIKYEIRKS